MWWTWVAMAAPTDAQLAEVAATAGMTVDEVKAALDGVTSDPTVLERMAKPWEAKPWHAYRKLFLTDARIEGGRAFLAEHADTLARAESETGVPREVVVAILGVETSYGTKMGDDDVKRALYTLGFEHPKRGSFFRSELGHYLRLSADQGWEAQKGSYAGAMGMGQFMPSSYRSYAVDFDHDGDIDLFTSPEDAIGSVANYFAKHGWVKGGPVLLDVSGDALAAVTKGLEPDTKPAVLAARGITVTGTEGPVKLLAFDTPDGKEVKAGAKNFYVITRYNHSPLYARAVFDLATALSAPPQ
ncbi:MAG: lytic murein transglycosylase B [Myxococcales bacterium]|nr:lytic murein transglycosylase B [Myxococcales bacterium]